MRNIDVTGIIESAMNEVDEAQSAGVKYEDYIAQRIGTNRADAERFMALVEAYVLLTHLKGYPYQVESWMVLVEVGIKIGENKALEERADDTRGC